MSEEHNLIPFIDHQLTRLAGNQDYSLMFQALTVAREAIIKASPDVQWQAADITRSMTEAELRVELGNTQRKLREMTIAEKQLSDAYIRIRELVGTIRMTGPIWANTEEAVKKLVEGRKPEPVKVKLPLKFSIPADFSDKERHTAEGINRGIDECAAILHEAGVKVEASYLGSWRSGHLLKESSIMAEGVEQFAVSQERIATDLFNKNQASSARIRRAVAVEAMQFADKLRSPEPESTAITGASPTCDHHWIRSEGRTSSGVLCNKCGAFDVPDPEQPHARFPKFTNREFAGLQADGCAPNDKPCVLCGVVSEHPEGYHYCKGTKPE